MFRFNLLLIRKCFPCVNVIGGVVLKWATAVGVEAPYISLLFSDVIF